MRYRIPSALITIAAAMLLGSGPALAASNSCRADLNGDLVVNFADLAALKSVFFQRCNDPGPTCGDALAQGPAEQCDDGNLLDGDGCSATCTIEPPLPGNALLATGQTTCWNTAGAVIPCLDTGHDGDLLEGVALAYVVDNVNGTITDSNTGLMWEKLDDNNVGGIHDWTNTYTWDNAFAVKIATLNAGSGFAAHTDWRVPNRRELDSIVNLEIHPGPTVASEFNTACTPGCTMTSCSCTQSDFYWSSSSYALIPAFAWYVDFFDGFDDADFKAYDFYVRAVRGGP
jgi:cysteine-rich repeat protein